METTDITIEMSIMYVFSQKHIFDNLRTYTTKVHFCCLKNSTITDTTNPTQKPIPITKDMTECEAAYAYWVTSSIKGSF